LIGRISGVLIEKKAPQLLVDVQGVGYELLVSLTTFFDLPENDEQVTLYTHLVVREDIQQLYGFREASERELFRMLIKISGVGPKMALTILSGMNTKDFFESVQTNDIERLVKLPGVGKKTAERLAIEMKDCLPAISFNGHANKAELGEKAIFRQKLGAQEEAESVLIALGYKPQEATHMIASASKNIDIADDEKKASEKLIRLALKSKVKS
jgi:Holliday junction DNA helicase RuvA